jgi:hypothetical protein
MEHTHGAEEKLRRNIEIYLGNAHHRLSDLPLPPEQRTPEWVLGVSEGISSTGTRREKQFHKKFEFPMDRNHLWCLESLAHVYFYKDVYDFISDYEPESRLCQRLLNFYDNGTPDSINLGAGFLVWLWIHEVPYDRIAKITQLHEGDLFQFYKLFLEVLNNIRKAYRAIDSAEGAQFFHHWIQTFRKNILLPESLYLLEAGYSPHPEEFSSILPPCVPVHCADPPPQRPPQKPDRRPYLNIRATPTFLDGRFHFLPRKLLEELAYEESFMDEDNEDCDEEEEFYEEAKDLNDEEEEFDEDETDAATN